MAARARAAPPSTRPSTVTRAGSRHQNCGPSHPGPARSSSPPSCADPIDPSALVVVVEDVDVDVVVVSNRS